MNFSLFLLFVKIIIIADHKKTVFLEILKYKLILNTMLYALYHIDIKYINNTIERKL